MAKCVASQDKVMYTKRRKHLSCGGMVMYITDENVNVQDEAEYVANGIEKYLLKQSVLDQNAYKKSKSTKRAISKTKKEKSIYLETLNLLIENRKKILSYKLGRKAFKSLRKNSYERFIKILKEYGSNNGINDIYYCETDIDRRDTYLEWLYGIKKFKSGVNDLSKYNSYYFDYIIDAPYVYTDKSIGKTYLYIELHYVNRIKTILIDSDKMSNKNLLYKAVANHYEMESFKREVFLSHKLAMLTFKRSSEYILFHDSDRKDLLRRVDEDKSLMNEIIHYKANLAKFKYKNKVNMDFTTVMEVLERYDLVELWGVLVNYNYAYPKAYCNKYYFAQDKANTYIAENLICDILNWLEIEDLIPIIYSDQKLDKALQKNNTTCCLFNDCKICGIVIKRKEVNEIKGVSFDEYRRFRGLFEYLVGDKSDIDSMRYNNSERMLYGYLEFRVKYSSSMSNETVFAAFNGLFYFYSYFIKKGVIKYDSLFKVLENTFKIDIDIDEIIRLDFIPEDYIVTEKSVSIDKVNDELSNEVIDEYESNIARQQMSTAPKQYNTDDVERVYKSMCDIELRGNVIYDEQNKEDKQKIADGTEPFLKYFKKKERYALCFLEDEKSENYKESKDPFITTLITKMFQEIDGVTVDKKAVDMLYKCILEHNRRIDKKTVGSSYNLKKINVFSGKKHFVVFLDVDNKKT